MFETLPPPLTIPSKCEGCAVQCETAQRLAELAMHKQHLEHMSEHLMGDDGERFNAFVEATAPEEAAEDIKLSTRKSLGAELSMIDEEIEDTTQQMALNAETCSGVLKMRASKNDVTYTVAVCTAPEAYKSLNKPNHVPAHIAIRMAE